MKGLIGSFVFLLAAAVALSAPRPSDPPGLGTLKFLEGKWVGEGSSEVGRGGGYALFEEDLQGKVIVRRNHAAYPASHDHAAYQHDDLMVIYIDPSSKEMRAFYTDNEGHVIQYAVRVSPDGKTVSFLGTKEPGTPQYRLTYVRLEENKMSIALEGRGGNHEGEFQKIIEGKIQRVLTTK